MLPDETAASLARLEHSLRVIPSRIAVLFRDDDVTVFSPQLNRLLNMFQAHDAPLHLAVIPARVTRPLAQTLRTRRGSGEAVEIGQHGFSHANHSAHKKQYEFGPRRSYAQQVLDMQAGKKRMERLFGSDCVPVFTPPYNRYDSNTLRAATALGFEVFSAADWARPFRQRAHALHEVPVNLDPIAVYLPQTLYKSPRRFVAEICHAARTTRYLSFVLHHELFAAHSVDFLQRLLATLARLPNVRFYRFVQYAQEIGSSPACRRDCLTVVRHILSGLTRSTWL